MSEVKLFPLPPLPEKESDERGEEWIEPQIEAYATAYARANMEPLLAENERLRAEVAKRDGIDPWAVLIRAQEAEARAERLAEALRLFLQAGVGNSTDFYVQHNAILAAYAALHPTAAQEGE